MFLSLGKKSLWWQLLHVSVRGMELWQLLLGRLTGICYNEITQVLVDHTIPILIGTVANCRIQVNIDFRFTKWMWLSGCGVLGE